MQKMSQKLQSVQDKKGIVLKEASACEEEMRKVNEQWRKGTHVSWLRQRSRATVGWRQMMENRKFRIY